MTYSPYWPPLKPDFSYRAEAVAAGKGPDTPVDAPTNASWTHASCSIESLRSTA